MSPQSANDYLGRGDFVYRHEPVPVFVKAKGCFLEDTDGYRYLDAEAANGTASLGFDGSILTQAVRLAKRIPSMPSFCETSIRLRVGKRIGRLMEASAGCKGRVAFELGGAQGMELALKVVRSNQNKSQLVVFEGGYHGRSIFTSQLSASHRYRSLMGDWRIPITRLPYPDFEQFSSKSQRKAYKLFCMAQVKKIVEKEIGGLMTRGGEPDVAALIFEPVLNAGGIVKPDRDYLEEVVKMFRGLGALIVADEIFCGFYRTGPLFGFQHYGFIPDIVVMSKAITNGVTPFSCVWARDPYMLPEKFPPGTHSATFVNNSLALSAAEVVLKRYLGWERKEQDLKKLERSLRKIVNKIVKSSKLAKSGYALGGVARILLKKDVAGQILDIARTIGRSEPIRSVHGLILASTGMAANVVALNPPLNMTVLEVNILENLLVRTFEEADRVVV